jgi:hypothetical protein
MHSFIRWSAFCASLIAGTFVSEFISTQQEPLDNATPVPAAAARDAEMPADVAFSGVTNRRADVLNR